MDTMKLRTGTPVTRIALGGAQLGNLGRVITDDEADDAVNAAWEGGIRYFDTAPHYGLGLSERRLGRALSGRPRDEYVVSTKVGRLLVSTEGAGKDPGGFDVPAWARREWDFSRDGVLRSLESSIERLGLDRVDIVYLHDPDDHWEQASSEGIQALIELREQGVVSAVGIGMNQSAMPAEFVRQFDIDVVMLAGRYTLLEQPALMDLLPLALERGVSIVDVGVYNSGLLARDRVAPNATYEYAPAPLELVERANRIAEICERFGTTLPTAALQFPLRHAAVASVAVGCRNRVQVESNLARAAETVPDALWPELVHHGLIPAEVLA